MPSVESWINRDDSEGEYVVDVQLQGFNPRKHSPSAALNRIIREAKKALWEADRMAAADRKGDGA